MRFVTIFALAWTQSVATIADRCTWLCINDGPGTCTDESWTDTEGNCRGYVFVGSGDAYCYGTCENPRGPVTAADVIRLFPAAAGEVHEAPVAPHVGPAVRSLGEMSALIAETRVGDVELLCGAMDDVRRFILATFRDPSLRSLRGEELLNRVHGAQLLALAGADSSCRDELTRTAIRVATERRLSASGLAQFCETNDDFLRGLIKREPHTLGYRATDGDKWVHGFAAELPRHCPAVRPGTPTCEAEHITRATRT